MNSAKSQLYIFIPSEEFVISLLNSYFDINFEVVHAATNNRHVDGIDIRLVKLGPIDLFSNKVLTTSSGKHIEDISRAHILSSTYKLLASAKRSDDLSLGFDRYQNRNNVN